MNTAVPDGARALWITIRDDPCSFEASTVVQRPSRRWQHGSYTDEPGQRRQLHGSNTESAGCPHEWPRTFPDQHGRNTDSPGWTRTNTASTRTIPDLHGSDTYQHGLYGGFTDIATSPDRHRQTRQFLTFENCRVGLPEPQGSSRMLQDQQGSLWTITAATRFTRLPCCSGTYMGPGLFF